MSEMPFQILMVDDDPDDIKLAEIQLSKINMDLDVNSVGSREAFQEYLKRESLPDLVICDYQLPEYNGEKALEFVRDLHDYLPFILVTGYLGEEEAVELMRNGASDIITKQKLERLGPAVQRELINFRERRETQRELENAQNRFRSLVEQAGDVVVVLGEEGYPEYVSPSVKNIFGYTVKEAISIKVDEITHPDDFHHVEKALKRAKNSSGDNISVPPVRMKHQNGTWRWCKTSLTDLRHEPSVSGIVDNIRDIHEQVLNARNNQLMLNNTEDSFIYVNQELIIQSFNDRFAKNYKDIFGIEVKRGESILKYAQPERREIVKDIYDRVLQGETVEGELPLEAGEGIIRHFHVKYKPARDENKKIIGSFISLIEITEEKKAKKELEKNEARFRALVENGSDFLFILNPEGETKYISPSIKNVLGYTAEEAMQINMMENAHPDDIEMIMDEIEKCLGQPGVPLKVPPARLKDKDGHWHWFEGTITNMLHDPAIEGIVDNFHEITERVEAEKKTAEAKNQYQSLIQTVDGIVWEADAETLVFNYVSPQAKKILGYSPEEWIGKKDFWKKRIHPEDRERAISFCSRQTDKGVNHTFEYRMKKANGDYIWLRDVVTVVKDQGEADTLRGLMIDINQEKELELKLEQAYQLAKIGNWELDLVNEKLYWSEYINELHEVDDDYEPNLDTAINFYKEGWSRDTISRAVENSVNTGQPFDLELQIETAKGNERWVRAVGHPDFVDDTCVRIYGSTQDITEKKEVELVRDSSLFELAERVKEQRCLYEISKLEEQELTIDELLQKAVSLIPDGWQYPEITEASIIWRGRQFATEYFEETDWLLRKEFTRIGSGNLAIEVVYTEERPELDYGPFLKEEEELLKVIGEQLALKIEQIVQKQELDEQRQRLQNIMDRSVDMICTARDGVFLTVSAASKMILGYKPEEMEGRPFTDFLIEEDTEETRTVAKHIQENREVTDFENRYRHKDGHTVPLIWSARWDEEEQLIYAIARDATEIKQAEREREFQRKNTNALINSTGDLIWSVDSDFNLITANESFTKTIENGFDVSIKAGDSVFKGFDQNSSLAKTWKTYYKRALAGETFIIENEEELSGEGRKIWYEVTFHPIYDGKSISGVACFARNITETKTAQIERRKAEQKYRNVVEHSTNMFYQHDTDGVLTYVSPQSKQFLGYSPKEAMRHWTEFITDHPLNTKGEEITQRAIETGEVQEPYELQLRTADNRIIWVEVNEAPLKKEGEVVGIVGSLTDITDRKDVEDRLKESLERYEYLTKATYDAIWDWDLVDDTLYWGEGFEKLFGHSMERLAKNSSSWTKYIHPDDEEWVYNSIQSVIEGTDNTWYEEYRYERADGSFAYVEDRGFIIRNERGEALRMIGAMRDVSEKKELQELLEQAQRMARIGAWKLDIETQEIYWSPITREIHETEQDFEPNLEEGINFYKEGQSRDTIKNAVEEAINHGTHWDLELQIVTAKGNEKWVRAKGAAEMKDGECIRVYGSFQDIHDRKAAEEKMVEAYEQRQQILETTTEAYFALARDYTVTYWNRACEEMTGIPRKQVLGLNLFEERPETKNFKLFTDYQKQIMECTPVSFEEYNPEMDRWFDVHAYPTEKEISVFFRDISERKFAEKEIKLVNEKLKTAQEIANLGYFDYNLETGEIYWSEQSYKIWGFDPNENLSLEKILNHMPREDQEDFLEQHKKMIETGNSLNLTHRILGPDGSVKWVRVIGNLKKTSDGTPVSFEGTTQDITDRVEAEQERVRILESISDAFYALDSDWNFTYFNNEAENLLNRKAEDLLGKNVWKEFPEARQSEVHKIYKEVAESGISRNFEYYYPPLEVWLEISAYSNESGLSVFFRDINERKEAALKLEQAYQEKETILESIDDGFFTLNEDWTVTYWNTKAEQLLHTPKEKIVGENLWDIFDDAVDLPSYKNYHKVMKEGVSVSFEDYYEPIDRWFDVNAYPSDDGISVYFKDITHRKKNEVKIQRINERFEKVTEATNDAIWDFDVTEDKLFWGKGFDTLFGYDLEKTDPSLSFLLSLIHPDDRERVSEKIEGYMAPGGESDWLEEYRFRRADGTYAYVMDRAVFIRKKGKVTRVVGAMTDLTRQKEYEESLKTLNKQLEERADELAESNAELEQFAYVASHDLQEPLRMVSSFLTQLEKKYSDKLDEKALQYIDFAVDGASRMRQIILDLLNYSRLNRDQEKREATNLNDLIEEVMTLSRSRIERTGAKITVDDLPTLDVNPGAIKQVFQNLVSNALKYQELGSVPEVHIKAEEQDDYWRFAVRDNGIGIREEFRDTIFQLFQRLHTRDQYSGTGIGLAIAKKIVERHGGEIWVESEEGRGSTFYFTLEK